MSTRARTTPTAARWRTAWRRWRAAPWRSPSPPGQAATAAVLRRARARATTSCCPDDVYYGTRRAAARACWAAGGWSEHVDMTDLDAVARRRAPATRLVWVETPSNPRSKSPTSPPWRRSRTRPVRSSPATTPGPRPCARARSSWAPTLSMHSTTKYLGGHSDLTGGAVIAAPAETYWPRVRQAQTIGGACRRPLTAGCCCAGSGRCPGACARTARTRSRWRGAGRAPTRWRGPLSGAAERSRATRWPRGRCELFGGMVSVQVQGGAAEALDVARRACGSLRGPRAWAARRA